MLLDFWCLYMKKLVIILTYNEIENIREIIAAVNHEVNDAHILIVDDNSPDGTGKVVDELIAEGKYDGKLFAIHRPKKLGVASGYIDAYNWALKKGYDACMEFDADFSHDLTALNPMFDMIKNCDLVIGSRYVKGSSIKNWNWKRKFISYYGNLYERIMFFSKIHDLSGGMNCYRPELLRAVNLKTLISSGYLFHAEVKFRAELLKAKIKEYPICFSDRVRGKSKMSASIFTEVLFGVIILAFSRNKIKKLLGED